ncbi:iron complex outermembrane recepter protein [Tenacibaculum sp. 190524A02b]|uniref:Iron complex outermembrane recepter protein n=1 Tax=Tenacibaculum vairaonense TaxID=3137860 RepID=A0ABP1FDC8_9FLAO
MILKTSTTRCLWFLCFVFFHLKIIAQQKKEIPLAKVLDIVSSKHQIYFTYNPLILKNKVTNPTPFYSLKLKETLTLLQKVTNFKIEYLGNKYYVIYSSLNRNGNTSKNNKLTNSLKDSIYNIQSTTILKGIVVNEKNEPINKANIIESLTLNGTISKNDGTFEFPLIKNNPVTITHIGYQSQTVLPSAQFVKVILKSGVKLDEVLIVGSRNQKRQKIDSPVATDVIELKNFSQKSQLLEVNQFMQAQVPSFNATKQSGSDGADHITPATYRGLGPDQTLVLINGKRRHQASLINLYGTRGRGNSGTDLNTIPTAAIKRIEILKDGASAQYGSDAIAGVINVVLKDTTNISGITSSVGFYNANNNTNAKRKGIDGANYKVGLNYGAKVLKKGFVNISAEFLSKDHTFRQGTMIRQNYGDAALTSSSVFLNTEVPIDYKTKFYANGGFNYRNTSAYAFTRKKESERNITSIYPEGFNPLITSNIVDKSVSIGVKSAYRGWNIDVSNTYGKNYFHYFIKQTLNATLLDKSPKDFDAGGHSLRQNTTNIDMSKHFSDVFKGVNIAFGLENRIENYAIFSGEEASYASYDSNGFPVTKDTPLSEIPNLNGVIRPGGSQGFPGYSPENEVNRNRSSISIYFDSEFDFTKEWLLATALRFENYSDFGSTLNTKLASRLKLTPKTTLRTSFSTGFRAPSLAQIYYNLKFTNYIDNKATESFLIANNNPITQQFGISQLKEEKAINYSFGFLHKCNKALSFGIDTYYIFIKDRIILSGNFDASPINTNVQNVQFFANGVNTDTYGFDVKLNWLKKLNKSQINLNFTGNFNTMKISKINNKGLDIETFFGNREQYFLLASAPKHKLILNANYATEKFLVSGTLTRFSALQLIDWQVYKPLDLFNNSPEERLNAAKDYYLAKYTLDVHTSYKLSKKVTFQLGANNLFNTYPTQQGINTDSGGLWDAVQMGTNGTQYYSKIQVFF